MVVSSFKVCGISNNQNGCEDHLVANTDILLIELIDDVEKFDGFTNDDIASAINKLRNFVL